MINPFSAIKAYFVVQSTGKAILKEAQAMNGTKPGWKTTEFWFNLAAQVATMWGAVSGFIPPRYAIVISTVGIAVYTVSRTVAKAVSDVQAARTIVQPAAVTATATAT